MLVTKWADYENWATALSFLEGERAHCEMIWVPLAGDSLLGRRPSTTFPTHVCSPVKALSSGGFSIDLVRNVVGSVIDRFPDFVMLGEIESDFSQAIYEQFQSSGFRGKCVGLQNCVAPDWNRLNRRLNSDYWFCFGQREVERLAPMLRLRTFVVGLPRLDRLAGVRAHEGGYILYVPQPSAIPQLIDAALRKLEFALKVPIVVNSATEGCRHRSALPLPAMLRSKVGWTELDYIRNAEMVITLPSESAFEALYLKKPLIILPNANVSAFDGCPGVAKSLSPSAIHEALQASLARPDEGSAFLNNALGGVHFHHRSRFYDALVQLVENPDYNDAGAPHLEAERREWRAALTHTAAPSTPSRL